MVSTGIAKYFSYQHFVPLPVRYARYEEFKLDLILAKREIAFKVFKNNEYVI